MPNHYKFAGNVPTPCLDCPVPPDSGASPSSGPGDPAMVSASNPTQPCGPPPGPPPSPPSGPPPCTDPCTCGGGGGSGGPGGGPGGSGPGGGGPGIGVLPSSFGDPAAQ